MSQPDLSTFKRAAIMTKLEKAVTLHEILKRKMENMDDHLNALLKKAYPNLTDLVNADPDEIEKIFRETAYNPGIKKTGGGDEPEMVPA